MQPWTVILEALLSIKSHIEPLIVHRSVQGVWENYNGGRVRRERETQVSWRQDTYSNMFPGEGYQGNGSLSHIWKGKTGGEGEKEEEEEEEERQRTQALAVQQRLSFYEDTRSCKACMCV